MHVEFDRGTCIGMFQCVDEWAGFERDLDHGKATLVDGESGEADGRFVREVPAGEEAEAELAARVCPVDAITLLDDEGERLVP